MNVRLGSAIFLALVVACSGSSSKPAPAPDCCAPPPSLAPGEPTGAPAQPAAAVPGEASPAQPSPSRVVTEVMYSPALGVDKRVVVYLPRGYDSQPARRYPVYFYLHGLGGNEENWVKGGALDAQADQLGVEAIIAMPDGDDGFYIDSKLPIDFAQCLASGEGLFLPGKQAPETTCVKRRNYETYVTKDLVSWVDGKYRTLGTREGRAIAGLSMGGFGAMALSLRHPELFAAAASHSGAVALLYQGPRPFAPGKTQLVTKIQVDQRGAIGGPIGGWLAKVFGEDVAGWKQYDVVELATAHAASPAPKVALYFDCGTEDDFHLQDNVQYVHEALGKKNIPHELYLGPGRHDFAFWKARLPQSLQFLRDHTAAAK